MNYKKLKDLHKRRIYYNFKKTDWFILRKKFSYLFYLAIDEGIPLNLNFYIRNADNLKLYFEGQDKKNNINYLITQQYNNENHRLSRCRHKIESYMQNYKYLYFATFTIDSRHYFKYNLDYSKFIDYIKYYLNKVVDCESFVFNLDWGSINGRLHAHGVLAFNDRQDFKVLQNLYSVGNIDLINCYNNNDFAISKYVNKLSNHAFKDTTLQRCVYSRKRRK